MNANELADKLSQFGEGAVFASIKLTDVATMLRQQQAEIETLKAGKIRAYDNGVEDGKKSNTHPAKTLTDEEIQDLIVNKITDYDMIREALRKAQEK